MNYRLVLLIAIASVAAMPAFAQRGLVPFNQSVEEQVPGKLIFKVKPEFGAVCNAEGVAMQNLNSALAQIQASSVRKKFPRHVSTVGAVNARGEKLVDISTIYEMNIPAGIPAGKAAELLMSTGVLEYAEPVFRVMPLFNPNDPDTASQYYLALIRAYDAWDVSQGDSNFVVGVTDTGTDLNHPDLAAGIKYNYSDPINGVDDDFDGFTDNFMGWDVGQNDNDPTIDIVHGSFVSGFAGAVTNNGIGIAGPGFKTRFLPVKISLNGVLTAAYDGIVYAADHGCQVINCSWGGFGGGQFGQDIVDYATLNKNALVVGASGNSNNENPFFPASYNNVLSVTGTNATDNKWVNSSYGAFVDISAPGEAVYSTIFDDTYSFSSGTSFAAPIVAAAAALIKTQFAFYSPGQIAEQLRATSDDLNGVPGNTAYVNKLGKGRLNMHRALTESPKSVRMEDLVITDNNDEAFAGNDTLDITVYLKNYLAPLTNLGVTLTSNNPLITIQTGVVNPGFMSTLATYDNAASPFQVIIDPTVPFNTKVTFTLNFSDGTYADWQIFDLVVNVDYINVLVNDVGTSITSKGRIGYNIAQGQGIGFTYNDGPSLLYEGGLIVGIDTIKVSDHLFGAPTSVMTDDFYSMLNVHTVIPTVYSDFDLDSRFNDDGADSSKLDVEINQKTYAWSTPADSKYIIVEYTISNQGITNLNDFYAGIYADWDIGNVTDNRGMHDVPNKMGYAFNTGTPTFYAGIKQLTWGGNNCYALDNDGAGGTISIYDGFTEAEKYQVLSQPRAVSGQNGVGNDVSLMVSEGPLTINAGDSVKVAFALIGGEDLASIQSSAVAAQIKYATVNLPAYPAPVESGLNPNYPNPFSSSTEISYSVSGRQHVTIEVFNVIGEKVATLVDKVQTEGDYTVGFSVPSGESGVFYCRMISGEISQVIRMMAVNGRK